MRMLEDLGLEYETRGDGDNILLIHGSHIADSFLPWNEEPALARYRLIRYHRRGFAGSQRAAHPFSIEQQAHDALRLLEHVKAERAHVVGHSYGGVISLQLALEAPDVVRSLALLEPPLMMTPSAPAFMETIAPVMRTYASGDATGAVDGFLKVVGGPEWRAEIPRRVPGAPEQAERDAATFFEVEMPALENWKFDAARASRITQPVLYVIGTESGTLFEESRQLIRAWLPQTEEFVVPETDHQLQMRAPRPIAQAVADFIHRHAA